MSAPVSNDTETVDAVYFHAAIFTGKPASTLRAMGLRVFASMLQQAIAARGQYVWTFLKVDGMAKKIDLEVGAVPPTRVKPRNTLNTRKGQKA